MNVFSRSLSRAFKSVPRALLSLLVLATLATTGSGAPFDQRLANLSTRGQVGTGANIMITGFVVQGKKDVLIRAVGPGLAKAPFNVAGALANPKLELFRGGASTPFMTNDDWVSSDQATMRSVGAFDLTFGSTDSALMLKDLDAGVYTAQVTGVNSGTGIALLEVYDVTGSPRLMNLSTRAIVGKDASMLISGLVVAPSGGIRRVLIRAIGPGLAPLGVANPLSDPVFSVLDGSGKVIAGNDNWSSGSATQTAQLQAAFTQAGAFGLTAGSKDAALIVDLPPNTAATTYTIQVSNVDNSVGPGLIEAYDLTPDPTPSTPTPTTPTTPPVTLPVVGVTATTASTDNVGSPAAVFTLYRLGVATSSLTVAYTIGGTATAGADYNPVATTVTFAAGVSSVSVPIQAKLSSAVGASKTVTLTLTPSPVYTIDTNAAALVSIFYGSGSLYVANLRTGMNVSASTAYGTSTIKLSADEQSAFINVAFSNLSSPEIVAHLVIDGNYVYNLPQGQVNGAYWAFEPTGMYSKADLIAALKAGRVYVSIDTANFPTGELSGSFLRSSGASAFTVPSTPPAVSATVTQQDAARFLTQATFGPTTAEITALMSKGYTTWINDQVALTPTLQRTATMSDFTTFSQSATVTTPSHGNRQAAWWKTTVTGQDQLRQRVAFALSEILVISDANGTIAGLPEATAAYYDILVRNAFGNYRTLLEEVTLNPLMGIYLSSFRNAKAAGTSMPDENYAREIMQLFTVGLNELQPDGSLKLDATGQPIPTYTQDTIVQMAKIFTGWAFNQPGVTNPNFRGGTADYINPMQLYPAFHDDTQKVIIGDKIIPANQGGAKDLKDTLDALFNHPNTGPFVCRQLIQRMVTSNPSPGYIYRVAQVFANNGSGVRGDLRAVVRAILTDYEARSSTLLNTPGHGKMKEPLIRTTALFRAYGAASNAGRYNISNPESSISQAALRAPTVFNFFEPDFVQSGTLASAGLYAPEFQILTDTTAITIPNFLYNYIQATRSTTDMTQQTIALDFASLLPNAKNAGPLVDALNIPLCAGTMPTTMRDRIVTALNAMPANTADLDRVRSAVYLVVTSPEGSIQK